MKDRPKPQKRSLFLVVAAVLAVLIALFLKLRPQEPLDVSAKRAYKLAMSDDPGALYDWIWPEEAQANPKLTADGVREIMKTMVRPRLAAAGLRGDEPTWCQLNTEQGVCGYDFKTKSGSGYQYGITCYMVKGKPKLTLSEQLVSAWIVEHMWQSDETFSLQLSSVAQIKGLTADLKRLKELGFENLVTLNPNDGTAKVTPLQERLDRLVAVAYHR